MTPLLENADPDAPLAELNGRDTAADEVEPVWVCGLPLAPYTYRQALDRVEGLIARRHAAYFITANLHYARLADADSRVAGVNRKAAFLLADGMPLVWYSRWLGKVLPERVAGADLIYGLCGRAARRGWRVYLLGAGVEVARAAAEELRRRYGGLRIVGVESPTLAELAPEEHAALLQRIRAARPEVLLVAFGQPKGEIWLSEHCAALGVPACVQLGASFDFVAQHIPRAPRPMQRVGMEWLYRIWREPRRMFPRYAGDAIFLARTVVKDLSRSCGRVIKRVAGAKRSDAPET